MTQFSVCFKLPDLKENTLKWSSFFFGVGFLFLKISLLLSI